MRFVFKRNGFTLVELLIVIVVIGVLSAMMILSSTEAVTSAKATAIISNMTNIKKAVVAWYLDNLNKVYKADNGNGSYLIRWSDSYQKSDDNASPIQELWESRVSRNNKTVDTTSFKASILAYISNSDSVTRGYANNQWSKHDFVDGGYILTDDGSSNKRKGWYVGCTVLDSSIKSKLAARAVSLNLLQTNAPQSQYYNDSDIVWMKILNLE